jgi:hypothetical protein
MQERPKVLLLPKSVIKFVTSDCSIALTAVIAVVPFPFTIPVKGRSSRSSISNR